MRAFFPWILDGALQDIPGHLFAVELRGPEYLTGTVEGPFDGTVYNATYCATVAGVYTVTIKVGRFALPGCPFQVTVRPDATDPSQCKVSGDGTHSCREGEEARFVLRTRDMHGNPSFHPYDVILVTIKGGGRVGRGKNAHFQATEFFGRVRNEGDGSYVVTYVPPFEGAFSMKVEHSVTENGPYTQVAGSPFQVCCNLRRV